MEKLAKIITDERMGLKYELCGDYYIIASEGVTEQLKADNQMLWVGLMNNISQGAIEIVNSELIYT